MHLAFIDNKLTPPIFISNLYHTGTEQVIITVFMANGNNVGVLTLGRGGGYFSPYIDISIPILLYGKNIAKRSKYLIIMNS